MNPSRSQRFLLSNLLAAAFAWGLGLATDCLAGGGPESVLLVVNPTSPDSLTVANHYIDLRQVPARNVFYLPWKRLKVETSGDVFRDQILKPILEEMNRRKFGGQVDTVVYSCDFPWRINFTKDFPTEQFPPALKPMASLNSATYLWSFVINKRKEMFGLTTNFYFSPHRGDITLSRAFHANAFWGADGRRTTAEQGIPYLMSTMLGVTGGRGNSVEEIVRYLESSRKADGTLPKGTIYYVRNNTPRSTPRHDLFPQAVASLALAGVHAEIAEGAFIQNKPSVMGVTCGAPVIEVAKSGCRFMPGSLCDNLTSAGGILVMRKGGGMQQTPLTDFLRFGAGGACGTVIEPMNFAQKFPSPFLHVHYARGCSLAESFYQSVAGPYQLLIVGDPLCQPWARAPEVTVTGIEGRPRISGTVKIEPAAKVGAGQSIAYFELFVDGERKERCRVGGQLLLDTTKLADGAHELRVVAAEASPIETQGRWTRQVNVKNGLDAIQISVDQTMIKPGMEYLTVNVASSGKSPVKVVHNGRELGATANGTGTIRVPVATLGSGPITLEAHALGSPGQRAAPLRVVLP